MCMHVWYLVCAHVFVLCKSSLFSPGVCVVFYLLTCRCMYGWVFLQKINAVITMDIGRTSCFTLVMKNDGMTSILAFERFFFSFFFFDN